VAINYHSCSKTEKVSAIPLEIVGQSFKMKPAKDEWKRDPDGDDAAPHEQHVRTPTKFATFQNEEIQTEIARYPGQPLLDILAEVLWPQEDLPTALPIERRRGRCNHIEYR
jgi:hypothetical protein